MPLGISFGRSLAWKPLEVAVEHFTRIFHHILFVFLGKSTHLTDFNENVGAALWRNSGQMLRNGQNKRLWFSPSSLLIHMRIWDRLPINIWVYKIPMRCPYPPVLRGNFIPSRPITSIIIWNWLNLTAFCYTTLMRGWETYNKASLIKCHLGARTSIFSFGKNDFTFAPINRTNAYTGPYQTQTLRANNWSKFETKKFHVKLWIFLVLQTTNQYNSGV